MDPIMNVGEGDLGKLPASNEESPLKKKTSKTYKAQESFFGEMKKGLADTQDNRTKMRDLLSKSGLSESTRTHLNTLLSASVTRSFLSVLGFVEDSSISTKILRIMSIRERISYFEQDGCQKGNGPNDSSYSDSLVEIGRFLTERDTSLDLNRGGLSALPVSVFTTKLKKLSCTGYASLTGLPVESKGCTNLEKVDFTMSGITQFDFTESKKLKEINLTYATMKDVRYRKAIVKGLPVGVPVTIIGLDNQEKWPENVSIVYVRGNKVQVIVHELPKSLPPRIKEAEGDSSFEIESK